MPDTKTQWQQGLATVTGPDGTFTVSKEDLPGFLSKGFSVSTGAQQQEMQTSGFNFGGTPEQTIGSMYGDDAQSNLLASYGTTPPSESDVYKSTIDQFQGEIDALTSLYAKKKSEITAQMGRTSEQQLGTQRALLASSGMIGQVGGMGEKSRLQTAQAEALTGATGLIEAELQSKISGIRSGARTMAQGIFDKKVSDYRLGQKAILENIANRSKVKADAISEQIKVAIASGWDLSLPENAQDLSDSFNEGGLSVSLKEIQDAYTLQKQEADVATAEAETKATKEAADLEKTQLANEKARYELENPGVKTNTKEFNGRIILYNTQTGETIKDLGGAEDKDTDGPEERLSVNEIKQYQKDYKDADIRIGDTYEIIQNKIDYGNIVSQGFSLDEAKEIIESNTPPKWFIDDTSKEYQMSISPDVMQNLWENYRNAILGGTQDTTPADTTGETSYDNLKAKYTQ